VEPQLRGAAYGLRQSLDTTGAFLGPAVAFVLLLASNDNYRLIFTVAILPAALAVLLLWLGLSEPERITPVKKVVLSRADLSKLGRPYWILFFGTLIFNLGNSSDAFLLLRSKQLGLSAAQMPLTLVLMNLVYSLLAFPFGAWSDKFGRLRILIAACLLNALVYAGFALASAPIMAWSLFAVYGTYLAMSQGVTAALVADMVQSDLRGTAFGVLNLAIGLTLLPASLLAGFLWDRVAPQAAFWAGSIFSILGMMVLLLLLGRKAKGE
jgi:MFS family permease